jgi:nucleotide-binding universal stress UspA family protein
MRKILLATDGSRHALRGAQYVSDLYKGASDVRVTLLNVSPAIPPLYQEERGDPQMVRQFEEWRTKREKDGEDYIKAATKALLKGGMGRDRIQGRYLLQRVGMARDIIHEVDAERSDACVVGKKGMGWFDNIVMGSITRKLLEISEGRPLWLVEGRIKQPRRVLIAIDETVHARDLARYAGLMLKGLEGVEILFYHYCATFAEELTPEERKRLREMEAEAVERERVQMLHYFEDAKKILEDMGMEEGILGYEFQYAPSAPSKKVSRAILDKVKEKGCGTLLIGRKGSTHAREYRLGSVAERIAVEVKECALWLL